MYSKKSFVLFVCLVGFKYLSNYGRGLDRLHHGEKCVAFPRLTPTVEGVSRYPRHEVQRKNTFSQLNFKLSSIL